MRKLQNYELNRLTAEEFRASEKTKFVVVLDNVRSHLNVGSVFRTCDAFLLEAVYLCGITGVPPHRDIQKTALGATDTVAWKYFATTQEAVAELQQAGAKVVAVEQADRATMLHDFFPQKNIRYAIVFGNEVEGVAQSIVAAADVVIEIPQVGSKHSLNIAVSAGVVLWEMWRKIRFGV